MRLDITNEILYLMKGRTESELKWSRDAGSEHSHAAQGRKSTPQQELYYSLLLVV